jgi:hypothetical protein
MRSTPLPASAWLVTVVAGALAAACAADPPPPPTAPPAAVGGENAPPPAPAVPTSATEVLAAGRAPLDACYAKAREAHPELGHTSVEITFSLDDEGKPFTVDLLYRNRLDETAKACMRTAAEGLRFPAGLRGKQVGVIRFPP